MRRFQLHLSILICSILMHQQLDAKLWNSVTSWFNSWTKKHEQTIDRQYRCGHSDTLVIHNLCGSVRVETEWSENTIVLSAKKTTTSPEALNAFDIVHEEKDNGKTIILTTVQHDPEQDAIVDYTLILPIRLQLIIETKDGNVVAHDIKGSIKASTDHGSIECYSCTGPITATVATKGSINIYQADGPVSATTDTGSITIAQSRDDVTAKTTNGRIHLLCKELPKNKEIWLQSKSGVISLYLPPTINADIRARTERSTVTCQLPITITEFSTTLDNNAWKRFKQEVQGILGASPAAKIRLYSKDSSIDIRKRED